MTDIWREIHGYLERNSSILGEKFMNIWRETHEYLERNSSILGENFYQIHKTKENPQKFYVKTHSIYCSNNANSLQGLAYPSEFEFGSDFYSQDFVLIEKVLSNF